MHCAGTGPATLVFIHGFGCDYTMWRFLVPHFEQRFRVVLYDLTGCGGSDLAAYDFDKYATLHGHVSDLLEVVERYAKGDVVLVGHSVGSTIAMLAAVAQPERFAGQVMVSPSPCFMNDGDYVGGFNPEDIDGLLALMNRHLGEFTAKVAPLIMGAPGQPALQAELASRFDRNHPDIMRHLGRVVFTADHRQDVARCRIPTLILQCTDDMIAPIEVGQYLNAHLPDSTLQIIPNVGHCPHMSVPGPSGDVLNDFLLSLTVRGVLPAAA
ncbi:alpha/beta hydrolase [Massilia sp. PAMC28688]|uniref:alpha/beta fold hydrolase n=1 Tax=Massilia sp. PAMC28688 TaxID=2861283 RepID=UPI0027D984BA|nr:alpha/beta hydrolase [Massilia sp. PAMC28688]